VRSVSLPWSATSSLGMKSTQEVTSGSLSGMGSRPSHEAGEHAGHHPPGQPQSTCYLYPMQGKRSDPVMGTFVCRCYRTAGPTSSLGPWIWKTGGLLFMRDAAGAGSPDC
jgi:hypothetical protein